MSPSSLAPRPVPSPPTSRHVAVIGALAAARELRREGHRVVVFERSAAVGGTWIYTHATESDALGLDPLREVVHSSLYDSLRTNLPRECMGFLDYPFSSRRARAGGDHRRFPGHREVLCYLQDFAREFNLDGLVRFRTEVALVERDNDGRWQVNSRRSGVAGGDGSDENEFFDGVVVCNGHYTEPRIAEIPGTLFCSPFRVLDALHVWKLFALYFLFVLVWKFHKWNTSRRKKRKTHLIIHQFFYSPMLNLHVTLL